MGGGLQLAAPTSVRRVMSDAPSDEKVFVQPDEPPQRDADRGVGRREPHVRQQLSQFTDSFKHEPFAKGRAG